MKKTFALLIVVYLLKQTASAQIGVSSGYKTFNPKGWNEHFERYRETSKPFIESGFQLGISYHLFGAKRWRIEFVPEFSYSKFDIDTISFAKNDFTKLEHKQFGFQLNTLVYIFDMKCDYKCDSISTIVGFLRKGFFVGISPIFVYVINKEEAPYRFGSIYTGIGESPNLGGSIDAGIDLEFSEKWKLTPIFRFQYFPDYSNWSDDNNIHSDLKQIFVGCRLQLQI